MLLRVALLATLAITLLPTSTATSSPDAEQTIFEVISSLNATSKLAALLSLPAYQDLKNSFTQPGNWTLFAFNDAAYEDAAGNGIIGASNVSMTTNVLSYHVVAGRHGPATWTLPVQFLRSELFNDTVVNLGQGNAQVLQIRTSDTTPPSHSIVFGLPGEMFTTANLVVLQIEASNGVVHVIDRVLVPPPSFEQVLLQSGLTEFLDAARVAQIIDLIDTQESLTVFVPTNEAFLKASIGEEDIFEILEMHVVPTPAAGGGAVYYSPDLTDQQHLLTLGNNDDSLLVERDTPVGHLHNISVGQGAENSRGNVLFSNILMRNGVVHIIDTVLPSPFYPQSTVMQNLAGVPMLSELVDILRKPTFVELFNLLNNDTTNIIGPHNTRVQSLTFFAPTNDALTAAGLSPINDADKIRQRLMYHIIPNVVLEDLDNVKTGFAFYPSLLTDDSIVHLDGTQSQALMTISYFSFNLVYPVPGELHATGTVQKDLFEHGQHSYNGQVYFVDTLITPPGSVSDLFNHGDADSYKWVTYMKAAGFLAEILEAAAGVTIFLPSDEAVDAVDFASLSVQWQEAYFRRHVCAVGPFEPPAYLGLPRTANDTVTLTCLDGHKVLVHITANDNTATIRNGDETVSVINPDVLLNNGVLHIIDGLLTPDEPVPFTPSHSGGDDGLNGGEIAAIFFAVLIAVVVIGFLIYRFRPRRGYGTPMSEISHGSELSSTSTKYGAL